MLRPVYGLDLEIGTVDGMQGREKDAVIKLSYQPASREREQDLVATARACGVEHLPELYAAADLWHMKDHARKVFLNAVGVSPEYEERTFRAVVYLRYHSLEELFPKNCLLLPVMVAQLTDCRYFQPRSEGIICS